MSKIKWKAKQLEGPVDWAKKELRNQSERREDKNKS